MIPWDRLLILIRYDWFVQSYTYLVALVTCHFVRSCKLGSELRSMWQDVTRKLRDAPVPHNWTRLGIVHHLGLAPASTLSTSHCVVSVGMLLLQCEKFLSPPVYFAPRALAFGVRFQVHGIPTMCSHLSIVVDCANIVFLLTFLWMCALNLPFISKWTWSDITSPCTSTGSR